MILTLRSFFDGFKSFPIIVELIPLNSKYTEVCFASFSTGKELTKRTSVQYIGRWISTIYHIISLKKKVFVSTYFALGIGIQKEFWKDETEDQLLSVLLSNIFVAWWDVIGDKSSRQWNFDLVIWRWQIA